MTKKPIKSSCETSQCKLNFQSPLKTESWLQKGDVMVVRREPNWDCKVSITKDVLWVHFSGDFKWFKI